MNITSLMNFFSSSPQNVDNEEKKQVSNIFQETVKIEKASLEETKKTGHFFADWWDNIKMDATQKCQSEAVAIVTSATALALRFSPKEIELEKRKNKASLHKIFGSHNVHFLLKACVPIVVKQIIPLVKELESGVFRQYFLNSLRRGDVFYSLLEVLIPQMIINLCYPLGKDHVPGNTAFFKIISSFVDLALKHQKSIEIAIEKEIAGLNPRLSKAQVGRHLFATKKDAIREIFTPLSHSFLALAFPKGAKEIPVCSGLDIVIWDIVQKCTAEAFFRVYWTLQEFQIGRDQNRLRQLAHGEMYDCLCDIFPAVAQSFGPKMLAMSGGFIASNIVENLDLSSREKISLRNWIKNFIADFSQNQSCFSKFPKEIIRKNLASLLSQFFLSYEKIHQEGVGSLSFVTNRFWTFVKENKSSIEECMLIENCVQRNSRLRVCCASLAHKIFQQLYTRKTSILLPHSLKEFFQKSIKQVIVKICAVLCEKLYTLDKCGNDYSANIKKCFGEENYNSIEKTCNILVERILKNAAKIAAQETEEFSTVLFNVIEIELQKWGIEQFPEVSSYIEGNPSILHGVLKKEIASAKPNSFLHFSDFLKIFLFKLLSDKIDKEKDPSFFASKVFFDVDSAALFIEILSQHFSKVSRGISQIYKEGVSFDTVRRELTRPYYFSKEELHLFDQLQLQLENSKKRIMHLVELFKINRDIEQVREALMAENTECRRLEFAINSLKKRGLKPFSEKIFGFMDFESLQLPESIASEVSKSLKENIIPEIVVGVSNAFMNPTKIHKLFLNFLQGANALSRMQKKEDFVVTIEDDRDQESLNRSCERLYLEIVSISNQGFQEKLLKNRSLSRLVGKFCATLIKNHLSFSLSDCLTVIEECTSSYSDEEAVAKDPVAFESSAEKIIAEYIEVQILEEEIQRQCVEFMQTSAFKIIASALTEVSKKVSKSINGSIEKNIGKLGCSLKHFIGSFFQAIFSWSIGPLIFWITYPIYSKAAKEAKKQLSSVAIKFSQAIDLSFNMNLVFDICNLFLQRFNDQEALHSQPTHNL